MTIAPATAAGWQFSKPSVVPGFGLALGFTLVYLTLIILIPLSGLAWRSAALGWSEFSVIASDRRVVKSLELSFGACADCGCRQCGVRLDRRLGAGALPLPRPPHRRCHGRPAVRAADRGGRHRADLAVCAEKAGSGICCCRSASRSSARCRTRPRAPRAPRTRRRGARDAGEGDQASERRRHAAAASESTIRPFSRRTTLSARVASSGRWTISRTVRPGRRRSIASPTSSALTGSRLAVGSSRITSSASRRKARAIAIRWRSPAESGRPPSPTTVS